MNVLSDIMYHPVQALSKNGKVYGNGIMVGVQQCIDKVSLSTRSHAPEI